MNILITGSGGREHALVRALSLAPSVNEIHVSPGSNGISERALCSSLDLNNFKEVQKYIDQNNIDLVIIGPEDHLVTGLANYLRDSGTLVVGPDKEAAQLEGSKIFAKEFMKSAGIPTADFKIVDSVESTMKAAQKMSAPFVLKADGLAAGKGVVICKSQEELKQEADKYFNQKIFGKAGEKALLENFEKGFELSYLIITNGHSYEPLPLSQDHKKLYENDLGPNTGGMGAVAPVTISKQLHERIKNKIVLPSVKEIKKRSFKFNGILFIGIMITKSGPKVIEYNVRMGDPEAQVLMPLFDGDWGDLFLSLAKGQLKTLSWKKLFTACVVLASEGYPANPKKDVLIDGDLNFESPSSYFLHAGTKKQNNLWKTNGGRVLHSIGIGTDLTEAISNAYKQSEKAQWQGQQMRKDIGSKQTNNV